MKALAGVIFALLLVAGSRPAAAQQERVQREPPREVGRAAAAGLLGVAVEVGVAGVGGAMLFSLGLEQVENDRGAIFVVGTALLLSAPAAGALTACGAENGSAYYSAGCGRPVLAAYAGAAAGVGLIVLASSTHAGSGAEGAALLSALLLPPALAVATWELLRAPRQQPSLAPSAAAAGLERPLFERAPARRAGLRAGLAVALPVFKATF